MFTFKKFALAGAVVAALSMTSCSDKDDDPEDEVEDVALIKKNFTLSEAGASYGDLDAAKTCKQTGPDNAVDNAEDIDVVAYYTSGAASKVFNPCGISYEPVADECGMPELYPIPDKYQAALKSATKISEIADFLGALGDITGAEGGGVNGGDANAVWEIDISNGKSFLVLSTDSKYFIVTITSAGAQTVSLSFSSNAFEKKK